MPDDFDPFKIVFSILLLIILVLAVFDGFKLAEVDRWIALGDSGRAKEVLCTAAWSQRLPDCKTGGRNAN